LINSTRSTLRIAPWVTANRTADPLIATRDTVLDRRVGRLLHAGEVARRRVEQLAAPLWLGLHSGSSTIHLHVSAESGVAQVTHGAREDDLGTRDAVLLHEPHVLDSAARRVRAGRGDQQPDGAETPSEVDDAHCWSHAVVLWHASHSVVPVGMCPGNCPIAITLLWQPEQTPRTCV
jgi:hypothetical protein